MAFSVLMTLRAAGHAELARRVAEEVMVAIGPMHQELHNDIASFHSSETLQASKISPSTIDVLRRLLKVGLLPYDDVDPQLVLNAQADEADDWQWDNTPEPAQRTQYMQTLLQNLQPLLINRSLEWEEQVVAQGLLVKGLGKQLVARSDELIYARRWHFKGMRQHGAVIGVELKKRLSMASRRQGEAEFYIFSLASNFPFLQVVTDMVHGGFAYWKKGDQEGQQLVYEKVLVSMDALYDFLRVAVNKLPCNLGQDEGNTVVLPVELSDPSRRKLVDPIVCASHACELSILEGPFFDGSIDDLCDFDQSCTLGCDQRA